MGLRKKEKWFFDQRGMVDVMQHYFDNILMKNANWEILSFYLDEDTNKFVVTYRMVDETPTIPDIKIERPGPTTITIQID